MKAQNKVVPPRGGGQPGISSTLKIYGAKLTPTVRVCRKDSTEKTEMVIGAQDFDPDVHERLE